MAFRPVLSVAWQHLNVALRHIQCRYCCLLIDIVAGWLTVGGRAQLPHGAQQQAISSQLGCARENI
jgi:hypothetical protein